MSALTRRGVLGATAASLAPLPAVAVAMPAGPDAELLRLCAEFYTCDEQVKANDEEVVWEAWLDKRTDAADVIEDIVPTTDEGLRAKAAIAIFLLKEAGEEEFIASDFGRMALNTLRNMAGRA